MAKKKKKFKSFYLFPAGTERVSSFKSTEIQTTNVKPINPLNTDYTKDKKHKK